MFIIRALKSLPPKTRILAYIALGGATLSFLGVIVQPVVKAPIMQFYSNIVVMVLSLVSFWLALRNIRNPAAILIFGSFLVQFLFVIANSQNKYNQLIILPYFILGLIAVALIYNSRIVFFTALFSTVGWPIATSLARGEFDPVLAITSGTAILFIGSLLSFTIRLLEQAATDAEQKATSLRESEATLKTQTEQLQSRTEEAESQRREATQALEKLQRATNERDDLARSLQEATLPIMPVHEHVVVMPLVGAIDTNRAHLLNETLLRGIERNAARVVIIDITGVPLIDTQVAGALLRSAEAARLLGAHTVLVGIRPEVAQTIVGLGLDLRTLNVTSDLQSGIARGMQLLTAHRLN